MHSNDTIPGILRPRYRIHEPVFRVDPETGCWIWLRTTTPSGYGVVNRERQMVYIHVVMWESVNGPVPDGMEVTHVCPRGPNKACGNPAHLRVTTPSERAKRTAVIHAGPRPEKRRIEPFVLSQDIDPTIPYGYCKCGCGQKTRIAPRTLGHAGWIKGEPIHYLPGHSRRQAPSQYIVDEETGCWIWQWSIGKGGYGHVTVYVDGIKKGVLAHRFFYEQANGPIPEGLVLDHICPHGPNRRCVNPDHVEPVLMAVNVRRGRGTKLTEADVILIREAVRSKSASQSALARRFGVTVSCINSIVHHRNWQSVVG